MSRRLRRVRASLGRDLCIAVGVWAAWSVAYLLEALYGSRLVRMVLYGSQARGDAEPGSDINVLVVLQGPVSSKLLAGEKLFDYAVSHAYYTMFYVAEALLLGQNLAFSKHSAVLAAFGERLTKPGLVPSQFHKECRRPERWISIELCSKLASD